MTTKRMLTLLITLILIFSLSLPVLADDSRSYEIDLCVNGAHEVQAKAGDILTVTMTLKRTDSQDPAPMYAMQDEIRYDPTFFEMVDGSAMMANGVNITDIGLIDDYRAFYVNFLSLSGGDAWKADTLLGSFQMKVLGETGSSMLKNENCIISTQDGSGSYPVEVKDLLVIVSSECTINFDSMGGSSVPAQTVLFGEKVKKPEDPIREGYTFNGWYSDIYLKNLWNFEEQSVQDNMTLYAAWQVGSSDSDTNAAAPWWLLLLILPILLVLWLLLRKKKKAE